MSCRPHYGHPLLGDGGLGSKCTTGETASCRPYAHRVGSMDSNNAASTPWH